MSTLNVDKVDPSTGTALEIGSSGDTITVPSGATLTTTSATLNLPTTITATTEVKTNKVSPATGTAFALGDSGDTFTVPSGATIVNSGTATGFGITSSSFLPTASPLWYNGDLQVAQRGTTANISGTVSAYYTCDRWAFELNDSSEWTQSQDTDVPTGYGFAKSLKLDCTTLDATPVYTLLQQKFEGQDLQVFKKGTSNAEKYTVAFWVKSVKTGTYICELRDFDNNRTVSQAYTVDSGSTWENKILNFPADTTGAFGNDNNASLAVSFFLAVSSTYSSGSLATVWESRVNANRAVGQVNLADSTSNDFWITGVQLEVGEYTSSDLPPFRHETYAENLRRCFRYYEAKFTANEAFFGPALCTSSSATVSALEFSEKRTAPSCSLPTAILLTAVNGSAGAVTSSSTGAMSTTGGRFDAAVSGTGLASGNISFIQPNGDATGLKIDAEL